MKYKLLCLSAVLSAASAVFAIEYEPIPSPGKITATASSNYPNDGIAPGHALNFASGGGLDANGWHSTDYRQMWLTAAGALNNGVWYCVDLGEKVTLGAIKMWQYNQANAPGRDIREMDIYISEEDSPLPPNGRAAPFYSVSDGWSLHVPGHVFPNALTPSPSYPGEPLLEFPPVRARWVGLYIKSNHNYANPADIVGIAKIQFHAVKDTILLHPVTDIGSRTATLNAFMTSDAMPDSVTAFWGDADGYEL